MFYMSIYVNIDMRCPIGMSVQKGNIEVSAKETPSARRAMSNTVTKQPKVSVVVPVWNPGPGISRCIESLRSQTLEDIEIIFVDDCGTDGAMDKVRRAAEVDPRIRILENGENIGPGPSRNRGIEAAKGEYLSFVDPDDYAASDFYEKLYEKAKAGSLDIAKGTRIYELEDGTVFQRDRNLNQNIRVGLENGKPLFSLFTYGHQSAIYRRDLLIANDIRYGTTRRGQDVTFLLTACLHADRFALVEEAQYHFCERGDSAMHTINAGMLMAKADAFREQVGVILSSDAARDDVKNHLLSKTHENLREALRYDPSDFRDGQASIGEAVKKYAEALARQIKALPFCEELARDSFSIRALLNYGVVLPPYPYVSPWESATPQKWCAVIKRWSDFLEAHPECVNASRWDLIRLLARVFMLKRKPEATEAEAWNSELRALMAQIRRLPKPIRTEVYLMRIARALIPNKMKAVPLRIRRSLKK